MIEKNNNHWCFEQFQEDPNERTPEIPLQVFDPDCVIKDQRGKMEDDVNIYNVMFLFWGKSFILMICCCLHNVWI